MTQELTALASIFLYLFLIFSIIYLLFPKIKYRSKVNESKISFYLLTIGGLFVLFAIISPIIIFKFIDFKEVSYGTSENKSIYSLTGPLGDTLGGVMNPFIAIAGVIITGLAFYAQYSANKSFLEANKELKKQFKLQQFESQFYEMLKLHKENVNEMVIEGYQYDEKINDDEACIIYHEVKQQKAKGEYDSSKRNNIKETKLISGRKIFNLMLKEFHLTFNVVSHFVLKNHSLSKHQKKVLYEKILMLSYKIFFSGKDIYNKLIKDSKLDYDFTRKNDAKLYNEILAELEVLRTCHKRGIRYIKAYINSESLHLDFSYKPFGGHLIRLGHFYRHMYAIVNFVVNENSQILSYEDKRKYLKMFRAQLSNHEVALLYYNWLAGYGEAWEDKEPGDERLANRFFTDYRMIHNLDQNLVLREFDPFELFKDNSYRSFLFKEGKRESDGLFELFDLGSNLSEEDNRKLIN
ncbi:putative phage abortive infection protein [Pedobacter chitinilyticus]|uniref:Phage abortive infection protein n=1 Tax=Pedobacter chitinilyticus TaxID=2233776 RepID=A0A3S3PDQ2_9SPHI|nr:putative phage abortive infection protein [Pedobacter chitinilyticus]RWU10565.1 hypothetical protein DPV69_04295 [Pedobacter chitinilyticus]